MVDPAISVSSAANTSGTMAAAVKTTEEDEELQKKSSTLSRRVEDILRLLLSGDNVSSDEELVSRLDPMLGIPITYINQRVQSQLLATTRTSSTSKLIASMNSRTSSINKEDGDQPASGNGTTAGPQSSSTKGSTDAMTEEDTADRGVAEHMYALEATSGDVDMEATGDGAGLGGIQGSSDAEDISDAVKTALAVLSTENLVSYDSEGGRIALKRGLESKRDTLLLRDVPVTVSLKQIKTLFVEPSSPSGKASEASKGEPKFTVGASNKAAKTRVWYLKFASNEEAVEAAMRLRMTAAPWNPEKKIQCGLKSDLLVRSFYPMTQAFFSPLFSQQKPATSMTQAVSTLTPLALASLQGGGIIPGPTQVRFIPRDEHAREDDNCSQDGAGDADDIHPNSSKALSTPNLPTSSKPPQSTISTKTGDDVEEVEENKKAEDAGEKNGKASPPPHASPVQQLRDSVRTALPSALPSMGMAGQSAGASGSSTMPYFTLRDAACEGTADAIMGRPRNAAVTPQKDGASDAAASEAQASSSFTPYMNLSDFKPNSDVGTGSMIEPYVALSLQPVWQDGGFVMPDGSWVPMQNAAHGTWNAPAEESMLDPHFLMRYSVPGGSAVVADPTSAAAAASVAAGAALLGSTSTVPDTKAENATAGEDGEHGEEAGEKPPTGEQGALQSEAQNAVSSMMYDPVSGLVYWTPDGGISWYPQSTINMTEDGNFFPQPIVDPVKQASPAALPEMSAQKRKGKGKKGNTGKGQWKVDSDVNAVAASQQHFGYAHEFRKYEKDEVFAIISEMCVGLGQEAIEKPEVLDNPRFDDVVRKTANFGLLSLDGTDGDNMVNSQSRKPRKGHGGGKKGEGKMKGDFSGKKGGSSGDKDVEGGKGRKRTKSSSSGSKGGGKGKSSWADVARGDSEGGKGKGKKKGGKKDSADVDAVDGEDEPTDGAGGKGKSGKGKGKAPKKGDKTSKDTSSRTKASPKGKEASSPNASSSTKPSNNNKSGSKNSESSGTKSKKKQTPAKDHWVKKDNSGSSPSPPEPEQ
ncbi:unnamed protein product [Amoebophrya sp. A25]|nr:unnamed protein product [Amoebophrya sp. A25]|eukprot:GSA25T00004087001.1